MNRYARQMILPEVGHDRQVKLLDARVRLWDVVDWLHLRCRCWQARALDISC
jgi:hypothetical protein